MDRATSMVSFHVWIVSNSKYDGGKKERERGGGRAREGGKREREIGEREERDRDSS